MTYHDSWKFQHYKMLQDITFVLHSSWLHACSSYILDYMPVHWHDYMPTGNLNHVTLYSILNASFNGFTAYYIMMSHILDYTFYPGLHHDADYTMHWRKVPCEHLHEITCDFMVTALITCLLHVRLCV